MGIGAYSESRSTLPSADPPGNAMVRLDIESIVEEVAVEERHRPYRRGNLPTLISNAKIVGLRRVESRTVN